MAQIWLRAVYAALLLLLPAATHAQLRPGPPAQGSPAQTDPDFTVVNQSGRSIFFIRLRPPGSAQWGEDLLGASNTLRDGARFLVRPPRDGRCEWDLLLRFENEVERIFPAVPVCRISSVPVTPDLAAASGSTRVVPQGGGQAPRAPTDVPPQQRTPAPRPTAALRVTNAWRVLLQTVHVRPVGRPAVDTAWGEDLLGRAVLQPQEQAALRLPEATPCRVDIRAGFEMPNAPLFITTTNVDLCASAEFAARGPNPGTPLGTGSGFFVSREGHIATNQHVVHGCGEVVMLAPDGTRVRLRLLQNDPRNDLALLQLQGAATPAVTFRDPTRPLRQGEQLLTMGYPLGARLGNQATINIGILSALRGAGGSDNNFTFSAPLNPGNSGGPIFDDGGLLVGVAVSGLSGVQNVNFGIPGRILLEMLGSLGVRPEAIAPRDPTKPADLFERNAPMVMQLGCFA